MQAEGAFQLTSVLEWRGAKRLLYRCPAPASPAHWQLLVHLPGQQLVPHSVCHRYISRFLKSTNHQQRGMAREQGRGEERRAGVHHISITSGGGGWRGRSRQTDVYAVHVGRCHYMSAASP